MCQERRSMLAIHARLYHRNAKDVWNKVKYEIMPLANLIQIRREGQRGHGHMKSSTGKMRQYQPFSMEVERTAGHMHMIVRDLIAKIFCCHTYCKIVKCGQWRESVAQMDERTVWSRVSKGIKCEDVFIPTLHPFRSPLHCHNMSLVPQRAS